MCVLIFLLKTITINKIMSKPNPIIYRFCQEVNQIFNLYLAQSKVQDEKIWLSMIDILSHRFYTENLLFRDYAQGNNYEFIYIGGKRFHPEAWFYSTDVLLARRLTLANNKNDEPTNMHELLMFYLRSSINDYWQSISLIRRSRVFNNEVWPAFFKPVAAILSKQCRNLGNRYGEVSKRRRLEFGPYCLSMGDNHVEVAEELSLTNVLESLPVPLQPQTAVPQILLRVIETLNERYALLRSCGLPPKDWLLSEQYSISQLKQLKQFVKGVQLRLKQQTIGHENACRECFAELKGNDNSFIGFESFEAFSQFYRIETTTSSLYIENLDDYEEISSSQIDDDLLNFLKENPQLFNPVTQYVYHQLVVNELSLQALIKNTEFKFS